MRGAVTLVVIVAALEENVTPGAISVPEAVRAATLEAPLAVKAWTVVVPIGKVTEPVSNILIASSHVIVELTAPAAAE
jgi:hypothetical protein